jgi:hypothetical protein
VAASVGQDMARAQWIAQGPTSGDPPGRRSCSRCVLPRSASLECAWTNAEDPCVTPSSLRSVRLYRDSHTFRDAHGKAVTTFAVVTNEPAELGPYVCLLPTAVAAEVFFAHQVREAIANSECASPWHPERE